VPSRNESGGGPYQSKTLARCTMISEMREASWSAPALWRFGRSAGKTGDGGKGWARIWNVTKGIDGVFKKAKNEKVN
jgi:hypothetical protein